MKRLYRSRDEKMVAGVLGGVAEYASVDPTIIRLTFVLLLILTGVFPFVLLYVIAAIIIPQTPVGPHGETVVDGEKR